MTNSAQESCHATILDLIKSIDPYPHPSNPLIHPRDNVRMTPLHLVLADYHLQPAILPIGHIHPAILADMLAYNIEKAGKCFTFYPAPGPRASDVVLEAVKIVAFHEEAVQGGKEELTRVVDGLVEFMRQKGTIPEDKFGPNEDRFSIYASPDSSFFSGKSLGPMENAVATIARSRSGFLGCATFGVMGILYEGSGEEMKIWVQTRGAKMTYGAGQLDVTAGGAWTTGMTPLEGIVQECVEEAELPADLCTQNLKFMSASSFWMQNKAWVRPHSALTFEWQLTDGMPRPKVPNAKPDETHLEVEVDGYQTMTPQGVKQALLQGRVQPNAVYSFVQFLDRHGFLEAEAGMEDVRRMIKREQGVAKPIGIDL